METLTTQQELLEAREVFAELELLHGQTEEERDDTLKLIDKLQVTAQFYGKCISQIERLVQAMIPNLGPLDKPLPAWMGQTIEPQKRVYTPTAQVNSEEVDV